MEATAITTVPPAFPSSCERRVAMKSPIRPLHSIPGPLSARNRRTMPNAEETRIAPTSVTLVIPMTRRRSAWRRMVHPHTTRRNGTTSTLYPTVEVTKKSEMTAPTSPSQFWVVSAFARATASPVRTLNRSETRTLALASSTGS